VPLVEEGGLTGRLMKRDVQVVRSWDFDRMVPCHGDVMETGAKKLWNDLYAKFLK
jgi:hypothetical protein